MNREETVDFSKYLELTSLLRWMETYMRDASEEQLESCLVIKNEVLRRIISLDEKHMGMYSWRKHE